MFSFCDELDAKRAADDYNKSLSPTESDQHEHNMRQNNEDNQVAVQSDNQADHVLSLCFFDALLKF